MLNYKIDQYIKQHGIKITWDNKDEVWYAEVIIYNYRVCITGKGTTLTGALWSLMSVLETCLGIEDDKEE